MKTFFRLCAAFALLSFSAQLHAQCGLPWVCNYDPTASITDVEDCEINDCTNSSACNYTAGCAGDTGNHCAYGSLNGYCSQGLISYGFYGEHWPTYAFGNGNGEAFITSSSVTLVGTDNSGSGDSFFFTDAFWRIEASGTYSFKWKYETSDGPNYDPAVYVLDNIIYELTDPTGPNSQSGTVTLDLVQGQELTLRVNSVDDLFGAGVLTVHEFSAPVPIYGCTNPQACNYDALNNAGDYSCIYPRGCSDPEAMNYEYAPACEAECLYLLPCGGIGNQDAQLIQGYVDGLAPENWTVQVSHGYDVGVADPVHSERFFRATVTTVSSFGMGAIVASVTIPEDGVYRFPVTFSGGGEAPSCSVQVNNVDLGWQRLFALDFADEDMVILELEAGDLLTFRATVDGGSTPTTMYSTLTLGPPVFSKEINCNPGCTYSDATNYNPSAGTDDGSCLFAGGPTTCPADVNTSGNVDSVDLLAVLGAFGSNCP